jgi:hypothetical protein
MLQGAANDMTELVNKRIQDRSNVINDIQLAVAPYTSNKVIQDFKVNAYSGVGAGLLGATNQSSDDILYNASNYYRGKYGSSVSVFANIPHIANSSSVLEGFTSVSITVDPYIVSNFFGGFTPVRGQYLAFDNLQVSLDFAEAVAEATSGTATTTPQTTRMQAIRIPTTTTIPSGARGSGSDEPSNVGMVELVITDSNTNTRISYNIGNVDYYEGTKNAIVLDITSQNVDVINANDNQALQQLLVLLGVAVPSKLVVMLEQTVNDTGKARWTYKLMNLNMDTVMIMKKN